LSHSSVSITREREIDDIGIAEEVVEEGLDGVDGIGASELE